MSRGLRALFLAAILILMVALVAVVIWQAELRGTALVFGWGFLIGGIACTILYFTLSNEFLRRHSGEANVAQTRRHLRSGWIGILLGTAWLGLHYLDQWARTTAVEAEFKLAFNRGLVAAKDKNWQAAVDAFSEAVKLDSSSASAHRLRGVAYDHQGEVDRALADYSKAISLDPTDARVWYNRGLIYLKKQDFEKALPEFSEAIRLNPNYAKAYLARGRAYAEKGDDVRAKADQQKAVEIDPTLNRTSSLTF